MGFFQANDVIVNIFASQEWMWTYFMGLVLMNIHL